MQKMYSTRALRGAFLGGLALCVLALQPIRGDESASGLSARVRARMGACVDRQEIAGAVTVIGRKEGILSLDALGSLNLEKPRPMPADALFRIASMTKPITAVGIMILADEGKLAVDDPVEKYLPEFRGQMLVASRTADGMTLKKAPRPITLRDLLTHTSGLPGKYPKGLSELYVDRNRTLAEAVLTISQRPLEFEPGAKWSYCNAGIDTLGRVIEVVSGRSYEEFLQQRVLQPLGMSDTTFDPTPAQLERTAVLYEKKDGKLVPAKHTLIGPAQGSRMPIPAAGLYSTGADLAKLYQMMLGQGTRAKVRILSPASVAAMTKVQTGELAAGFTPGMGFGFGWGVVRTPVGVTEMLSPGSFGHGGAFGTQGWIDPQQDLFVILLIQRAGLPNADGSMMRQELQALAVSAVKK